MYNENIQSGFEKTDSCCHSHWRKEKSKKSRHGEYIGTIIFNLIFLWIVSNIPEWHLSFIKDNFSVVQWILYINILVQIGANFFMLVLDSFYIRRIGHIIAESSSFVTSLVLYYIFPFDFHNISGLFWLNWALPVFLIIGMVVSALKVINNTWKLLFRR